LVRKQKIRSRMLRAGTEVHVGVQVLVDHLDTLSDYLAMDPIFEQDARSEKWVGAQTWVSQRLLNSSTATGLLNR
jgi:hypothetical protein